ncbi:glutamine--fructose-6-phosphate transaminase (isomerizing) [Aurantivibrio plasticivorans]
MCGIVGAVAQRNITKILIEGLKRLEYRGYDSAGIAVLNKEGELQVLKAVGKVSELQTAIDNSPTKGGVGIAHTRWATHGKPSEVNAHPHISAKSDVAVVHNGIIENYLELRQQLESEGISFRSETDSEVLAHLIRKLLDQGETLLSAVQKTTKLCEGAYGIAVTAVNEPQRLVVARSGSPLVIGVGIDENFIASDQLALRQVTDRFVYLEEGDIADITLENYTIYEPNGEPVEREVVQLTDSVEAAERGQYRHYMMKEIHEQPSVIANTLNGRIGKTRVLEESFGTNAAEIFEKVEHVQIVACGTSYHSGLVAKYWLEDWAGLPCSIEVASEFRYRKTVTPKNCLFVTISQSGETADTLEALRVCKASGYMASLTICNVANSSLVRESDLRLMTLAGPEIGVASTKAFTTQLVALQLLAIVLGRRHAVSAELEEKMVTALHQLPELCEEVIKLDQAIELVSEDFADKHHALFLGRGVEYPIAMEGALKLKEISYIHAEAYPAGELKHGPLALVDADMPIVAVAPSNDLLEKVKSNLQEVRARGGKLFVFADEAAGFTNDEQTKVVQLPHVPQSVAPIVNTIPLQLLSYYVAILKGTDVDQPRNLAKSVTVE